jgi:hypothetical protein
MKKKSLHENKSLKTVYLYLFVVLLLICISSAVKIYFMYQQSKFDSTHEFVLAIIQQNFVKEIIAFDPENSTISLLDIQDTNLPYKTLAKNYGIVTDGYVSIDPTQNVQTDLNQLIWSSIIHTATWQSNLTALDKFRLLLFSRSVSINNKSVQSISLRNQTPGLNTLISTALNDQDISSENVTIQIINATNVTGLGQRLGKVLTNMGANVVDVSSSDSVQSSSTIAYYGNKSYTSERLQKFLGIKAYTFSKQTIADIVITIGTDKKNTLEF